LRVTWSSTAQELLAAVSSDPPAYFCATVTSPTLATITGWTTEASCAQPTPLSGSLALTETGFVIAPGAPPFALEGCNFEYYSGTFESLVTLGAGP